MTKNDNNNNDKDISFEKLDDICEDCQAKDESVAQNLILTGFKRCKSCHTSKTVFPI